LRRLDDKPFNSESRLRFGFVLSSLLLLFVVIDGLILTLSIRRGFSDDGDVDSCISPLIEGAGGGIGGCDGGGIDNEELLLSVCEVLSKPCHERRSFFAR